jgi:hypothetical protein
MALKTRYPSSTQDDLMYELNRLYPQYIVEMFQILRYAERVYYNELARLEVTRYALRGKYVHKL